MDNIIKNIENNIEQYIIISSNITKNIMYNIEQY